MSLRVVSLYWLVSVASAAYPQYHLVKQSLTWLDAVSYCRAQYTDLVSTLSLTDISVVGAVALLYEVWIGLYLCSPGDWRWSNGASGTFTAWYSGEPSVSVNSCGRYVLGKWKDSDCGTKYYFVCYQLQLLDEKVASVILDMTNSSVPDIPSNCLWPLRPTTAPKVTTTSPALSSYWTSSNPFNGGSTGGMGPMAGMTSLGPSPGAEMTSSGPSPGPGMTSSGPSPGPGMTSSRPSPGPGMTSSGPSPGPGMTSSRPSSGPGMTSSGPSPSAGMTSSGPSPGAGKTSSGPSPGAGMTSSGPSPGAGKTSSGPSPGPGMTSSGPSHPFSGPTPSSTRVVTTSTGNIGSRTTQVSSGQSSGVLDGPLHLVQSAMTWSESRTFCRTYYTDLASISSSEEQFAIAALLSSHIPSNGFWFGLKRNRFWGNWYWSDGLVWGQYSFWGESEPSDPSSKLCGLISGDPGRNFSWSSACCGEVLPFVCY